MNLKSGGPVNRIAASLDGSKNAFQALEESIRPALFCQAMHTVSAGEIPRFPETISAANGKKKMDTTGRAGFHPDCNGHYNALV